MPLLVDAGRSQIFTHRATAAASWWAVAGKTCVGAYQPKGAASLAASYTNLANAAAPLTVGASVTWDAAGGWASGGTGWLKTGLIPSATGWSMFVRFSDYVLQWVVGTSLTTNLNRRFSIYPAGVQYGVGTFETVAPPVSSGVLGVAGQYGYRNGTGETTAMTMDTCDQEITIFKLNGYAQICTAKIQALAIYSDTLTGPQSATLYTNMAAL